MVGAGITGTLIAERLTRRGLDVVLLDRQMPGRGSTAASTAMLLWEIDRPLSHLAAAYGFEQASRCYNASRRALDGLVDLVRRLEVRCQLRSRGSLYLAAEYDASDLRSEAEIRKRAGLPTTFLDYSTLLRDYSFSREGALYSEGAADADPVLLTYGLLKAVLGRGARLYQANAVAFDSARSGVHVMTEGGVEISAQYLVLATGYVMPDIVRPTIQKGASSWAVATIPQPAALWKDGTLLWEASKSYHYARTTVDGRVIFGGEDESLVDPELRDSLTASKTEKLKQALHQLWPASSLELDHAWSGTFDTTADGLPLIGRVPSFQNIFAAYGYGGNGVTFSYLAAYLIEVLVSGQRSPLLDDFALDRQAP
ncbi:FAD-dependent oxidoreductase [Bradyrhizobium liaoningense]|uniref:NAD(P)/FAD-dependent oxidoreductase n=1 Tax=Bradyrhizobium liaoningense TaxID=43992 RepID=UPI0028973572|nr:FAD-dependent oxidoreductase [Bradyrhizobium liaoningense]